MRLRSWVITPLLLLVLSLTRALPAQQSGACSDQLIARLPLIERPGVSDTNNTLVLLLSGDGGFANADEEVAASLVARGAAVLGVNMRSYLGRGRHEPDAVARDMECVARSYLNRWKKARLMLLGYSRGADIAPFIASRWPSDLRERVNMVALVSLSEAANFQFHLIDLMTNVRRDDDMMVAPELRKLRGLHVICIYGSEEHASGCRNADSTIVTKYARDGGHRLTGGFAAVARILEQGLRPPK